MCTTVFFAYCYIPDLIHSSDWGVWIIRQVTPSLPHLLTIKNGQGNTSPVSIWWFLTHHTAGGVCLWYLCIYLRQRWCFILNLCIFDEKHALKLLLKCVVLNPWSKFKIFFVVIFYKQKLFCGVSESLFRMSWKPIWEMLPHSLCWRSS